MNGKVGFTPYYQREINWEEPAKLYADCVGPGWQKLLLDLTEKLFALGWDGQLEQVKEKFGTLRFYWRSNLGGVIAEVGDDLVYLAEWKSAYTCEECGEPGKVRGDGWLVCACPKCWEKRQAKKAEREKNEV